MLLQLHAASSAAAACSIELQLHAASGALNAAAVARA
jgi:hypothetical protein